MPNTLSVYTMCVACRVNHCWTVPPQLNQFYYKEFVSDAYLETAIEWVGIETNIREVNAIRHPIR